MTHFSEMPPIAPAPKSRILPLIAVGCCTFVIGGAAAFGVVQWQAQQAKITAMSDMLAQLQQTRQATVEVQQAPQETAQEIATRNASLDLLAITNATTVAAPAEATAQVVQAAAVPAQGNAPSIANQIRAIASRASDPMVATAIASDISRRETISGMIAGINELADQAIRGEYTISLDPNDPTGKGIQIDFIGYEARQSEIETLLTSAALADEIAIDGGVVRNDGSIDSKLLLTNLVKRNLLNGSAHERATGERMRQQIAALAPIAPAAPTTGENRSYTVESGDSLAFISLQFYGDTRYYTRIFNANRETLSSPDKISVGQRLIIPNT